MAALFRKRERQKVDAAIVSRIRAYIDSFSAPPAGSAAKAPQEAPLERWDYAAPPLPMLDLVKMEADFEASSEVKPEEDLFEEFPAHKASAKPFASYGPLPALKESGPAPAKRPAISRALEELEPGFGEKLKEAIDSSGLTDPQVYRKAQVSRAAFNKIINGRAVPKRQTAVPLVLALELDKKESLKLLEAAGIHLSASSKFDLIIRWCLENGLRDIDEINDILYEFDQPLLGSASA